MSKKRAKLAPASGPTPRDIVDAWEKRLVTKLKPWTLQRGRNFPALRAKLEKNIGDLMGARQVFTAVDMRNSLRVAEDVAKICKILQPRGTRKEVRFDTLELVLLLCSQNHQVCKGGRGGGGWCDA